MADRAAFEGFYREHLARVVRACALVLLDRAAAEDVAAEAFARLWARWGSIEDEDHAGGFVFKTAMRLTRRRARTPAIPSDLAGVASADEIERALLRYDVVRALSDLPVRQRQAVVLRDWAGFETRDVAAMLGSTESTVRVHLARARGTLRARLGVGEGSER